MPARPDHSQTIAHRGLADVEDAAAAGAAAAAQPAQLAPREPHVAAAAGEGGVCGLVGLNTCWCAVLVQLPCLLATCAFTRPQSGPPLGASSPCSPSLIPASRRSPADEQDGGQEAPQLLLPADLAGVHNGHMPAGWPMIGGREKPSFAAACLPARCWPTV